MKQATHAQMRQEAQDDLRRMMPMYRVSPFMWGVVSSTFGVMMTLGFWDDYDNPWMSMLAALLAGPSMALPLSRRHANRWVGAVAAMGWVPVTALVCWQLHPPLGEVVAVWTLVSTSIALGTIAMNGRYWLALTVMLAVCGVGAVWGRIAGLKADQGLEMAGFLAPLLAGAAYAAVMRRAVEGLETARRERMKIEQRARALRLQAAARLEYRDRVYATAGAILHKIADGAELDEADRRECVLVEAQLRDRIRARHLLTDPMADAARSARERGARVSLMDDWQTRSVDEELLAEIREATMAALATLESGDALTVRLLPPGRRRRATVVVSRADGEGERREF